MILFGAAIPWAEWSRLGWRAIAFAVAVLLPQRIPAGSLRRRLVRPDRGGGPVHTMLIQDQTGSPDYCPFISLAIGVTGTPLTRLFGASAPAARLIPGRTPT